jgi:hypothetical protein
MQEHAENGHEVHLGLSGFGEIDGHIANVYHEMRAGSEKGTGALEITGYP